MEQQVCKRKVNDELEGKSNDYYIHFFKHFQVPIEEWGVYKELDGVALFYMHRVTKRPMMVIKHLSPETKTIDGYCFYSYHKTRDNKESCPGIYIPIDEIEDESDQSGRILYRLAQLSEVYTEEGELKDEEMYLATFESFLSLLNLRTLEQDEPSKKIKATEY